MHTVPGGGGEAGCPPGPTWPQSVVVFGAPPDWQISGFWSQPPVVGSALGVGLSVGAGVALAVGDAVALGSALGVGSAIAAPADASSRAPARPEVARSRRTAVMNSPRSSVASTVGRSDIRAGSYTS
jgi:hypothetical protein